MSGPPTPPPSSALEIEDATRTTIAPEPAPASTTTTTTTTTATDAPPTEQTIAHPPPVPTIPIAAASPYREAFAVLADLVSHGKFEEVVQVAETADMNVTGDNRPERLLVVAPLVLSYLILDDIPPAIHALSRLPSNLTGGHQLPKALLSLVVAVNVRKYDSIYSLATRVHEAAQGADTPDELKPVVDGLLEKFLDGFRRKTFELLSRAYTSVPLPLVQSYLSLPAERVLEVATQFKWHYDPTTQTLSPTPIPKSSSLSTTNINFGNSTLATFHAVASLKLE
ncbi:hypothetical protein BC629DRAFT_1589744 [Irpex lacteus]|nr:hypothetical protein BC629DRAFT_1589744 [Irpex lacteus]